MATDCNYGFVVQVSNNRSSANTDAGNVASYVISGGSGNDLTDNTAKDSEFGFQITAAGNPYGIVVPAGRNELTPRDDVARQNSLSPLDRWSTDTFRKAPIVASACAADQCCRHRGVSEQPGSATGYVS